MASIGMLDMLGTATGLVTGLIGEANPMLRWAYESHGITGFIAMKTFFVAWPVAVFGVASIYMPYRVDRYIKACIVIYLTILLAGIAVQFI
jgi:hypothetical protein